LPLNFSVKPAAGCGVRSPVLFHSAGAGAEGGLKTGAAFALAIFAREPIPGKTKTRLVPLLGPRGAAEFHRALVADALRKWAKLKGSVKRYVFVAGRGTSTLAIPPDYKILPQRGQNLNRRLEEAFALLLHRHQRAVIVGTDSPQLPPSVLRLALGELRAVDAVLGPCPDGGYYLIGLRRTCRGLLEGARLGTRFAFRDTLDRLLARGFSCAVLEPCADVDRPEDLAALKKAVIRRPGARRLMPFTRRFLSRVM
jgi:uncharacterized protein